MEMEREDGYTVPLSILVTSGHGSHSHIWDENSKSRETEPPIETKKHESARNFTNIVFKIQNKIKKFKQENRTLFNRILKIIILMLYFVYFGYAMYYRFGDEGSIRLLVCTIFGVFLLMLTIAFDTFHITPKTFCPKTHVMKKYQTLLSRFFKIAVFLSLVVYVIIDVAIDIPQNLISIAGLAIYIIVFFIFSVNPRKDENSKNGETEPPIDTKKHESARNFTNIVFKIQNNIRKCVQENRTLLNRILKIIILMLYFVYFGYAMYYRFGDEGSLRLLVCTIFGVFLLMLTIAFDTFHITPKTFGLKTHVMKKYQPLLSRFFKIAVFLSLVVYVIIDVAVDSPQNLISVAGLAIYIIVFFIFSVNPRKINWHTVFWGIALQYIFALVILRYKWGYYAFMWLGERVSEFISHSHSGAEFLFNKPLEAHFFAFKVLPMVVVFYTVINILYYLGVVQIIVRVLGRFLAFCMGTTPAESLSTAANIFMGMADAPLLVSMFLEDMTKSELHAIMTGGFATIAGSTLGAYVSFGVPANHLISASVMSAPAALAISKLAYPEVETSRGTTVDFYKMEKAKEKNVIEAASAGATKSIKLVAGIAVNVLAALSLLKFVNATLIWFGARVGVEDFTLEFICSYLFYPISFFMGIDVPDCPKVAELIGIKTFTNEFVAYSQLSVIIQNKKDFQNYTQHFNDTAHWFWNKGDLILNETGQVLRGGILEEKSEVIATYALCGFSNFGAIGILLGGLGALVPSRKSDLADIVLSAMVSGNVACFLTACVAGLLYKGV